MGVRQIAGILSDFQMLNQHKILRLTACLIDFGKELSRM